MKKNSGLDYACTESRANLHEIPESQSKLSFVVINTYFGLMDLKGIMIQEIFMAQNLRVILLDP